MEENLIRMARMQAWARAKAELESVQATFFGIGSAREGQFQELTDAVESFVQLVENEGLHE